MSRKIGLDGKFIAIIIVAVLAIVTVANCFSTVKSTQRGVMVTFGKTGDTVLEPGLHMKAPFIQKIKKYSISPNELNITFSIGDDGAVTSDMQTVGLDSTVFWVYDEALIVESAKRYDNISINNMIKSAMLASVKEVIGHYTAQEVIENQSKVSSEVKDAMVVKMKDKPINITMVTISNYAWSAEYDKMINETMVKKQQVKQAEQEVQITELNAQKQVKEAEAQKQKTEIEAEAALIKTQKEAEAEFVKVQKEAEANLVRAEKEAEAKRIEADALAYYYDQLAKNIEVQTTLTELEIDAERAERWDGREIPNYIPLTVAGSPVVMGN